MGSPFPREGLGLEGSQPEETRALTLKTAPALSHSASIDRQKRADREFAVIWNRDRDAVRLGPPLYHEPDGEDLDPGRELLAQSQSAVSL
jgi:hypothetical protein